MPQKHQLAWFVSLARQGCWTVSLEQRTFVAGTLRRDLKRMSENTQAQSERVVFMGPSKRWILVVYSGVSGVLFVLACVIAAGVLQPLSDGSASVGLFVALWFALMAAVILVVGLTYKRAMILARDESIVFVRGKQEYRRIQLGSIVRVQRTTCTIVFETKRETLHFYESEMHSEESIEVLWKYLGAALGRADLESREFVV